MALSGQDREEFQRSGFLRIRGLLADVVERVGSDFDDVVAQEQLLPFSCVQFMDGRATGTDGSPRVAALEPAGDDGPLRWLRDDPRVADIPSTLLGAGSDRYTGSLANLYSCNVHWHHDGLFKTVRGCHLNVMVYLDPLDAGSGALRVLPGSHREGAYRRRLEAELMTSVRPLGEVFGAPSDQIPSQVLDVVPGDVVVIDFDVVHASFHGGVGRRLLTMTYGPPPAVTGG